MRKKIWLSCCVVTMAAGSCFLTSCGPSNSANQKAAEVKRTVPKQSLAQKNPAPESFAAPPASTPNPNPLTLRSPAPGESAEVNPNASATNRVMPRTLGSRLGTMQNARSAANPYLASDESGETPTSASPSTEVAPPGRPMPSGRLGRSSEPEVSVADMLKVTPSEKAGLEPGDTILEIVGKDMESHQMSLSDYRGQVVMLDFWGDW